MHDTHLWEQILRIQMIATPRWDPSRAAPYPCTTEAQMKRTKILRTAAFALGIAGTLGFGATQALAEPAAETARGQSCYQVCEDRCGPEGGYPLSNGMCVCCS